MGINRIILIGNGFDLANGHKTSYKDFIEWYWRKQFLKIQRCTNPTYKFEFGNISVWSENNWYEYTIKNYRVLKDMDSILPFVTEWLSSSNHFLAHISPLFKRIHQSISTKKWVDIENEYYTLLQQCLIEEDVPYTPTELNHELETIKIRLTEYLQEEQKKTSINVPKTDELKNIFQSPIEPREISSQHKKAYYDAIKLRLQNWEEGIDGIPDGHIITKEESQAIRDFVSSNELQIKHMGLDSLPADSYPNALKLPYQTMVLNFNYTETEKVYIPQNEAFFVNHIHGTLSKSQDMIFGYGDELDENYKNLLKSDDKEYMRNIKSIRYLETDNYKQLLSFIESAPYQILILGHSCGLSDGTLLNTLFEHKNCMSIKPYYYQRTNEEGTTSDNYLDIVQNIARNFTNMKLMRDRVVNKTYCSLMPQAESL